MTSPRDRVIHGSLAVDEAIKATRTALEEGTLRVNTAQSILASEVERLRDLLTPDAAAAMARVKVALWHLFNDVRDEMAQGFPPKELPDPNDAVAALDYASELISNALSGEKP